MNSTTAGSITRELPALAHRASFRPETANPEKRTVQVTWTTGAKVLRGMFDRFWEELSLDPKHVRLGRLNGGAPLLDTHDNVELRAVLGVVEPGTARLKGNEGTALIRFAKADDDPNADQIFRKVVDGIIRNVSVGYSVYRFQKTEDAENKIPTYRAIDWEPFEISLVPVGADAGAGVRSADPALITPCEFIDSARVIPARAIPDADRLRNFRLASARF